MQLLSGFVYPLPILTIHDEDETLRPRVVVSPQRPNLVLTSDIPDVELDILIRYSLDVEPNYTRSEGSLQRVRVRRGHIPVGMVVTDWFNLSL